MTSRFGDSVGCEKSIDDALALIELGGLTVFKELRFIWLCLFLIDDQAIDVEAFPVFVFS